MNKKQQEELKGEVIEILKRLQAASDSKRTIRRLHKSATDLSKDRDTKWISKNLPKYSSFFANGKEINPEAIAPKIIEVTETWHKDIFRLARYYWSLPYTKGYGRRLRFLILDQSNNKLMGILGLQSPPLDFSIRDTLFEYPEGAKTEKINQTMDVFTLGALPPYNRLLGGKLVALSATANEVRKSYMFKYRTSQTILEKRHIPARLIALTTTSAFGRSSIYNRLTYKGERVAISLGYTKGYGSFHLSEVYPKLRELLEAEGISTKGGYGTGPRVVWSTCSRALTKLGLSPQLLKHGIEREGFLFPLTKNYEAYFNGDTERPIYYDRPFDALAEWWKERWLLPRASRVDGWHRWRKSNLMQTLHTRKK